MQFDETRCGAAGFCAMTVPEGVSLSVTRTTRSTLNPASLSILTPSSNLRPRTSGIACAAPPLLTRSRTTLPFETFSPALRFCATTVSSGADESTLSTFASSPRVWSALSASTSCIPVTPGTATSLSSTKTILTPRYAQPMMTRKATSIPQRCILPIYSTSAELWRRFASIAM